MLPVPPERMPGERKLAGVIAYDEALDELIANAAHTSARTLAPLLSKLRIQLTNQPSSFEILLRIEGRK